MTKDLMFDVEVALSYIKYKGDSILKLFSSRSQLYPFSTENISGYYPKLDFKDKRILTVAASGDHMFNAILYGAKEVDIFDINRFTKYYVDLKKAIIETQNYETFINFFNDPHYQNNTFDLKIYKEVRHLLFADSRVFWDTLYKCTPESSYIRAFLFSTPLDYIPIYDNIYLSDENYYYLQTKLTYHKINFIESNILYLNKCRKLQHQTYDLILLSNISDYIDRLFKANELKKYKELILKLSNNVKKDGHIAFAYIYDIYNSNYWHLQQGFNSESKRAKIFNDPCYSTIYFDNMSSTTAKDALMLYKKCV